METFLNSVVNLNQRIREDISLNPLYFDLIQLVGLSKEELAQVKQEVTNIELIHCHEFWELTEEIYKRLMLPTISKEVTLYFQQLQETEKATLEITYQFHPWQEFVLTVLESKTSFTLQTQYAEMQIQAFLDYLEIKDPTWIDDLYDFDYKFNFESEVESLFRELAFDCWKAAKQETKSQLKATMQEVNGGSDLYDLDTKQTLS